MAAEDYLPFDFYDDDDYDDDEDSYYGIACKYCGRKGFHWELLPEGYRLVGSTGLIHNCKARSAPIKLDLDKEL